MKAIQFYDFEHIAIQEDKTLWMLEHRSKHNNRFIPSSEIKKRTVGNSPTLYWSFYITETKNTVKFNVEKAFADHFNQLNN